MGRVIFCEVGQSLGIQVANMGYAGREAFEDGVGSGRLSSGIWGVSTSLILAIL